MARKVCKTSFDCSYVLSLQVGPRDTTMHLQCADCRYNNAGRRRQTRLSAFDIKEFLGTEIGSKTSFGYNVVG